MYQKVSTDLKFVDREKKTEKFWKRMISSGKVWKTEKRGDIYILRWTSDCQWKTAHRTCADSCHQGYDSEDTVP